MGSHYPSGEILEKKKLLIFQRLEMEQPPKAALKVPSLCDNGEVKMILTFPNKWRSRINMVDKDLFVCFSPTYCQKTKNQNSSVFVYKLASYIREFQPQHCYCKSVLVRTPSWVGLALYCVSVLSKDYQICLQLSELVHFHCLQ